MPRIPNKRGRVDARRRREKARASLEQRIREEARRHPVIIVQRGETYGRGVQDFPKEQERSEEKEFH